MLIFFIGLAISVTFGLLSTALIFYFSDKSEAQLFFAAYMSSFKTVISLGLLLGTALIILITQNDIPKAVEEAFTDKQLSETDYFYYKKRFASLRISITFMSEFVVIGFIIFYYCSFPLSGLAEDLMIIAACAQYALGVYIGRKLIYLGMMVHALTTTKVTRNLFQERELDEINSYVHVASTLTIIAVYIHVVSYYGGPFSYDSMFGQNVKIFIILPAVIATPVLLIFNFYPRSVLRKLYSQSIDIAIKNLQKKMESETLSDYEKRAYLIEFNKMARDELRYSLQLSLTDLPIGITILIMVLEPLLKK